MKNKEKEEYKEYKEYKKKMFLKKLSREVVKLYMVIAGMLLILLSSGFAGYGYLHYKQGLALISSPIILFNSYLITGLIAFFITLLYNEFYNSFVKDLEKEGK
jgi:hypothetical protein